MTTSPVNPPVQVDKIRQIWQRADDSLLATIARRLLIGRATPAWLTRRREATVAVTAQLTAIIDGIAGPTEIAIVQAITAEFDRARGPIDPDDTIRVAARTAVVGRIIRDVTSRLALDESVMARQLPEVWRRAILDTEAVLGTGQVTRVEAAQQILDQLASSSITRPDPPAG